jgi:ligand-binding sensor domain-containing protein
MRFLPVAYAMLCLLGAPACAQSLITTNYSIEQGLPSSESYDVLQDSKGYIWIATDRGVCRFDGYSFTVYTTANGLTDNTVFNLGEDDRGRVWFFPLNGQLCYFENDTILPYRYNQVLTARLSKARIARTFSAHHDTLTIGYLISGIVTVYPDGHLVVDSSAIKNKGSIFIAEDRGRYGFALGNLSRMSQQRPQVTGGNELYFHNDTCGLVFSGKATSQAQANLTGIRRMNGTCITYVPSFIVETGPGKAPVVYPQEDGDEVFRMFEDRDSCLWVSFRKKGTRRYAPREGFGSPRYRTFLEGQMVTAVCEDREKGFWFTTLQNGVYYVPSVSYQVFTLPAQNAADVMTVTGDHHSQIFFGFKNGPLCTFSDSRSVSPEVQQLGLDAYWIYSSYYDTIQRILWTGSSRGITLFAKNGKAPLYFSGNAGKKVCFDPADSTVWIWRIFALEQFDSRKPYKGLRSIHIAQRGDVIFCSDGKVMLGANDGVYQLSADGVPEKSSIPGLTGVRISDIRKMPSGELVFGTMGKGVLLLRSGRVKQISVDEGLCSNIVTGLIPDGDTVWVATNKGLGRIELRGDQFSVTNYSTEDGFPTDEFREVWQQGGRLYAATSKGLVQVRKSELSVNRSAPPVYFDAVQFPGRRLRVHNNDTLDLNYNEDQFTIGFTGLSFKTKGKCRYRFMMKGIDSEWQYTVNKSVQYTSLDPGSYTFELYAQNERGMWSDRPAVLHLVVHPPFWSTWWFIALVSAFSCALLFTLISARIRQLKNRNRMLEQLHNYRMQALAMQMNPHFLFNILNSIQAYVVNEDKKNAVKYLNKFAKLMRMELNNLRKEYVSLAEELAMLDLYLEIELLRYTGKFRFEIDTRPEVAGRKFFIPSMLIQPYVENAVRHGLVAKEGDSGVVSIRLSLRGSSLICEVEDNGIGRRHSQVSNPAHESAGMYITEQRLRLLCANNDQHFFLEIIDKKTESGSPAGTLVRFLLPYREQI